ncbi:MAG: tRNA (adenosine(37)-N6)-threonylcarbamoyltransferase complex ATPase subunit type 1 TsaE [Xanthomonadaceae bacterium]|jgi:tRNA threonylcarbamoyladenosine biosynthesis protein TsaE|nr:tRNA (adenosine(37)-N6)-threonylcarbamoyltransferase complex ATPase subunit type 1 TsaE [Xanthomonadaceae bacterium]
MMRLDLENDEATERLGQVLAVTRPNSAVVYLHGALGMGKSTLARAILRKLGVQGPIRSPSYTLLERYPLSEGEAWHLDLYRIADAGELDFLGLDEVAADLWLVEWPEHGEGFLPAADLRISLSQSGTGRAAVLCADSEAGAEWLTKVSI